MRFNNDVTYHKQWDTKENEDAFKKLEKKFFDRSYGYPSCPSGWAPEVLALLERIDSELGIERNTETIKSYYPNGSPFEWFIKTPLTYLLNGRLDFSSIVYGFKCLKLKTINPFLNKVLKPKVKLSQIKEKYGYLTFYFDCHPAFEEYIDHLVRETEIKLAIKGAYYPIETFWDSGKSYAVGTEYSPDTISVEHKILNDQDYTYVSETTYRNIMKDMGLDLNDINNKAIMLKIIKDKNG
jgi:hypothetical protein